MLDQVDAALARPVEARTRAALLAAEANARMLVGTLADAERAGADAVALGEQAGADHAVCLELVALSCAQRFRGQLNPALA